MRHTKRSFIVLALTWACVIQPVTVMWDLGGTLVEVHKTKFASELGFYDLTMYYLFDSKLDKDHILTRIFEVLELLGGMQEGPEHFKSKHEGINLPKHMTHWLSGKYDQDPEAFVQKLEIGIDKLNQKNFFVNKREYRIIRRAVRVMFDPKFIVKYQKTIKPMVKILEQIASEGKHTCMILSNWDAASFNLFLETPIGQELSRYVDEKNMVISGRIFLTKPHPDFFRYVLENYKLKHKECVFIDNDITNCNTAEALGIPVIHFTGNAKLVRKRLKKMKILK